MNPAVIIAWRQGEDDLQATIDSAVASIGKGTVIPIEDKTHDGPARTRQDITHTSTTTPLRRLVFRVRAAAAEALSRPRSGCDRATLHPRTCQRSRPCCCVTRSPK